MVLLGAVGGVALVTLAFVWAAVKVVSMAVKAGEADLLGYVNTFQQAWQTAVVAILLLSLGPGIVRFITDVVTNIL